MIHTVILKWSETIICRTFPCYHVAIHKSTYIQSLIVMLVFIIFILSTVQNINICVNSLFLPHPTQFQGILMHELG